MKTWFYNRSIYVLETLSAPRCFVDYEAYHTLVKEVVEWRAAAIHRYTPFVAVYGEGDPNTTPTSYMNIGLIPNDQIDLLGKQQPI
jgi:hypothetical protein